MTKYENNFSITMLKKIVFAVQRRMSFFNGDPIFSRIL